MIQQMLFYTMFFSAASTDLRPEAWEVQNFPNREQVSAARAFNCAYRRQLESRQALLNSTDERWIALQDQISEAKQLWRLWDTLDNVQINHNWPSGQRDYLNELRGLMGWENYYTYQMPPSAPIWYFKEIEWSRQIRETNW